MRPSGPQQKDPWGAYAEPKARTIRGTHFVPTVWFGSHSTVGYAGSSTLHVPFHPDVFRAARPFSGWTSYRAGQQIAHGQAVARNAKLRDAGLESNAPNQRGALMSEQENEAQATEAPAETGELTEAQARRVQQEKRTKAAANDLKRLAKMAKQLEDADKVRSERNELIQRLVADGVDRKVIQENSGLTVPRFRQVASPKS